MGLRELVEVARGGAIPDLLLANARVVNVFGAEVETGNVAIHGGRIAGIGDYTQGKRIIDLEGRFLAPGLIDGHIHLESTMLHLTQYARAAVPRGTLAVVTDLHEIANVCGLQGIRYMMRCSRGLPLSVFHMLPSCVPATGLETSGADLPASELRKAVRGENVVGLGEMMNFPGVLFGDSGVLAKLEAFQARPIDGHSPGLSGKALNGYISAGIGSDHESTTLAEAREKLLRGMYVMIREGSSEKNLQTLLPLVNDRTYQRCFFVIDDRTAGDLHRDGDMDAVIRKAIGLGLDPIRAIQMATINTANYFRLQRRGAVAPGYFADLITVKDLQDFRAESVFYKGELVALEGRPLFEARVTHSKELNSTFKVKPFGPERLLIQASRWHFPVIEVVPGQIVTRKSSKAVKIEGGLVVSDVEGDVLKLAVVERHRGTGNIGVGMAAGFGLKEGALASSVAHDSHNIIAVGVDDAEIYHAVKAVEEARGGLAVASGGKVDVLPLPVAGLLSEEPLEDVVRKLQGLESRARELGCRLESPFATLSFLALPVIPELRLTDLGLVDVGKFEILK